MSNDGTVRPIEPFLPTCSVYTLEDFRADFGTRGIAFNLSNAGDYIYDEVVPSIIPGLVVGALALLGFFFFLAWLCVGCCCACCCGRKKRKAAAAADAAAAQQFMLQHDGQGAPPSSAYPGQPPQGRGFWHKAFWAFFFALSLAVVGMSAWGMAQSINLTDTTVSDLWDLVDDAQLRVEQTIGALQQLQAGAQQLYTVSGTLANNSDSVALALEAVADARGLPLTAAQAQSVAGVLADVPGAFAQGSSYVQKAIDFLSDNVNETITDIEDDFKPPTMAVQETWRFIPFAVIFGVLIVVTMLLMPLLWRMTWPLTAALLVAFLWLCVCLLMLIGTGMLNGVYVVSSDACLFVETFVVAYAWRKLQNTPVGEAVVTMVEYYLGKNTSSITGADIIPPDTGNRALEALQVYLPVDAQGVITSADGLLQNVSSAARELAGVADDASLQDTLRSLAGEVVATALQATGAAVDNLQDALGNLTSLANRTNAQGIYHDTKEYL